MPAPVQKYALTVYDFDGKTPLKSGIVSIYDDSVPPVFLNISFIVNGKANIGDRVPGQTYLLRFGQKEFLGPQLYVYWTADGNTGVPAFSAVTLGLLKPAPVVPVTWSYVPTVVSIDAGGTTTPIQGAKVSIFTETGQKLVGGLTDASGEVTLSFTLPPGQAPDGFTALVSAAGYSNVVLPLNALSVSSFQIALGNK
jgi:hypothetical protein